MRARDYVARYMAEKYTPEELEAHNKATAEWLESLPEIDHLNPHRNQA